jgi:phosphoenolpyruvate-protein phosphotransferase
MNKLIGLAAAPGIAMGPAFVYHRKVLKAAQHLVDDVDQEFAKLESALVQAEADLAALTQRAREQVGEQEAAIFEAQASMVRDPELQDRVRTLVKEQSLNIGFAWQESVQFFAKTLRDMEDEYLSARAADVEDVGQRVLSLLLGQSLTTSRPTTPSVILAEDLTPADTVLFDRATILAYCTQIGGPTSHVAILSKAQGLPCIVGAGPQLSSIANGTFVVVDGSNGVILIDPDLQTKADYESKVADRLSRQQEAVKNARLPARTSDGTRVEVVANVGSQRDASEAMEYGAEGIGLLRTEFLFLDRASAPDESEQVETYSKIFKTIGPSKPIVVRTLDIGGDKPAPYLKIPKEENPFLGLRGVRLTLRYQDLFESQLRALLVAGVGYDLRIMFPMVSALDEIIQVREIIDRIRSNLTAEGKAYCEPVQVGIMIEVPSAAIMATRLADHVDFFSIGTNDLSQYTLAAERTSADVAHLADAFQPAVIELIRQVIESAHRKGKWVGVCGELAGEPLATPLLLGLQLDEFSASPKLIPEIKQMIRRFSSEEAREISQKTLQLTSAREVREYLQTVLKKSESET